MHKKAKLIPDDAKWILTKTWYDGSWGGATSNPLVQEEYLSKEVSDKIMTAIMTKYDEIKAKIEKAKGDARKVDFNPDHFDASLRSGLSKKESIFAKANEFSCFAETFNQNGWSVSLHLLCVKNNNGSWHRKGGVDRLEMLPLEKCFIGFDAYMDENYNNYYGGIPNTQYSLKYDFERGQFRFRIFNRVSQNPCEEWERKRRNWPRTKYRNLYLAKCMDKIKEITNNGFVFSKITENKWLLFTK
jgi:hypothetical protein